MSWIHKLQDKWKLKNLFQVVIVLIVFACTGFTVLFIREPFIRLIKGGGEMYWGINIIYILCILPIYNVILLFYGFIFGQFEFFWRYEQKMLKRLGIKRNVEKD